MKSRNYSIDFLRLVSILGVVLIHISNATLSQGNYNLNKLPLSFFLTEFPRFAVPVFFLISGYLLMTLYSKNINISVFYKKRIVKILPPYIIWSAVSYIVIGNHTLTQLISLNFISALLSGTASYQFYFIPAILILYLIFPFILIYEKVFLSKRFVILLTGLVFLFTAYIYYWSVIFTPTLSSIRIAFINLLPFVLGMYYVKHKDELSKYINFFAISAVTLTSLFVIFMESYILFYKTGDSNYIRNQWRPSVLIYGISMAPLLVLFYKKLINPFNTVVFSLSSLSFGVFFVHVLILNYIWDTYRGFLISNLYSWWLDPLVFTMVVILSLIFSFGISKIPVVNKLLGVKL